jgi:threonine aldolase
MATAAVGDDVWGEDPTIAALEARSAALTGKAAAVWVPSGTMGNAVAVLALAAPARAAGGGVEVLVGDQAHIYQYEQGGLSALGGLAFNVVPTREGDGTLALPDLAARLRPSAPGDGHAALTAVLCLESTHNRCGGAVLPLAYMDAVKAWADGAWAGLGCGAAGLPIHLDGARLFNAAAALGCAPSAITSRVTTVTFCLSKGAGAPAGSVVCGPADAIARARRWRKMLGGGLRQAGVLAAAGLVALDEGVHRAVADAGRARRLAAGLAAIPGIVVHTLPPQSNIVIFGLGGGEGAATDGGGGMTHDGLVEALAAAHSVRVAPFRGRIRAVTSAEVGDEDVDAAVAAVRAVVAPSTAASGR